MLSTADPYTFRKLKFSYWCLFLQGSKFISKSCKGLYHFFNRIINFMPVGRHSILHSILDTFSCKHHPCDILGIEMGPSCTRFDQISHFKILYIRFIGFKFPSLISSRYVSKCSQSVYNPGPSKVPKYSQPHIASYSSVLHKRVGAKSQICLFRTC